MVIGYFLISFVIALRQINIDPGSHRGWIFCFHSKIGHFQGPTVNLPGRVCEIEILSRVVIEKRLSTLIFSGASASALRGGSINPPDHGYWILIKIW